ncbi:MAG: SusC/RagA family TonB-linked outer membrane protein [Bacteroidota bacterium]
MRKTYTLLLVFLLSSVMVFSQTRTVTGTVSDAKGDPVPFASIKIKGGKGGVSADANGSFTIKAKSGDVLVITSTDIAAKEVTVGSDDVVNVEVVKTQTSLTEVVVTALGVKKSEKALGYAISKVDPNLLLQKSEPDVLKSLQGKVAGVDIRSSQGTPGAATRIQIRGNSSFFGDNEPLIIVDGISYSNDFVNSSSQTSGGTAYSSGISNLDPNDIASINVLKGSSAAALYGSRASNGVIIITTKSGSATRNRKGMEVSVKSSASIETIANLPEYQNTYGSGSLGNYSNASNGSWGAPFSSLDSVPAWANYQAAYPNLFPSGKMKYRAYPDNVKDLFKTGTVIENSIGFNGGDEKSSVAVTASQLNHNGYVPNSKYDRSSLSLGGNTKLKIGLNVRGNLSYTRAVQQGGFFGEQQVGSTASQFARSLFLARNWDISGLPYQDAQGNELHPGPAGFDNPRWDAEYNKANTAEDRVVAGLHMDFNINKWAKIDFTGGTNVNSLERKEITEVSSRDAEGLGRIVLDNYRNQTLESTVLLTLNPTIVKNFSFRATLGHNFFQNTTTRNAQTGKIFITRGIYSLQNTSTQNYGIEVLGAGNGFFYGDYYERRRLMGVFGEISLGYKDFAFLSATGRNDWSSTLPVNNRSYFYPSVAGSFVFTDAFQLHSAVLDYGKIRANWAKVGRDALPYSLEDAYILGVNFLGQNTASLPATANSPTLKPEFTTEVELGTQLSFFKKLVEFEFTWYNKISTNLIAPISVPASSGYTKGYTNFGKISNTGVEIELTIRPVRTKDFRWELHGVFTQNKNIVKELIAGTDRLLLGGVLTSISPYLEAGQPFGYLRGQKSLRDSLGNLLINPATGAMIQATAQNSPSDLYNVGNPNPDYKLGIGNTLTYKGLSFNVLFDMTKGGAIYSSTIMNILGRGVSLDTRDRETVYVIPGVYGDPNSGKPILDGSKNEIKNVTRITANDLYFSPGSTLGQTFATNTATEWNVYDGTVYRLREITLAYEIPKSVFRKLPVGSVVVSLTGRNLWYLAPNTPKYMHFDPEVNSYGSTSVQGFELAAAPTVRRFGLNLNITF